MGTKYKVAKKLTVAHFKCVENEPLAILVLSPMFAGKEIKESDPTKKKKDPATLINCMDLETGELGQVILHAMVKSVFSDEYPNDSYVGKCFVLTKGGKVVGRSGDSYSKFDVVEIEAPDNIAQLKETAANQVITVGVVDPNASEESTAQTGTKKRR